MIPEIGLAPVRTGDYERLHTPYDRTVAESLLVTFLVSIGFVAGVAGGLAAWSVVSTMPLVGGVPGFGAGFALASGFVLAVLLPMLVAEGVRDATPLARRATSAITRYARDRPRRPPPETDGPIRPVGSRRLRR